MMKMSTGEAETDLGRTVTGPEGAGGIMGKKKGTEIEGVTTAGRAENTGGMMTGTEAGVTVLTTMTDIAGPPNPVLNRSSLVSG